MSKPNPVGRPVPAYETRWGRMYEGNSEELLRSYPVTRRRGRVQLILTSPPFVLNRKKKYGNLQGEEYVNWIASYATLFREYVGDTGSIVLELGNAWNPGKPTMSTLAMEALLAFKKNADLHLCQEFICYNPARLPTPAQWVTVKRTRVKDSFTRIWWMSASPTPKADNRKVLTQYSEKMLQLLKRGTYNSGRRPSEHGIGKSSFLQNHGGAIPPNVLVPSVNDLAEDLLRELSGQSSILPTSNTRNNDDYQSYCRAKGISLHPARMPSKVVEFFIRFLTDKRDLVMDPFAGSNTTGAVAEGLGRKWLSFEQSEDYVRGSIGRFKNRRTGLRLVRRGQGFRRIASI